MLILLILLGLNEVSAYIGLHAKNNAVACNDAECDSELVWANGDPFKWSQMSGLLTIAHIDPTSNSPDCMVLWMKPGSSPEYEIIGMKADDSWDALVCEDASC